MAEYRQVDPKLPTNPTNPTMTQPIINAAEREAVRRYRALALQVNQYLASVTITAENLETVSLKVSQIIAAYLEERVSGAVWFSDYTEQAGDKGAEIAAAALLLLLANRGKTKEQIIYSDAYINLIKAQKVIDAAQFKELSAEASSDIAKILNDAIKNGASVDDVAKQIKDRLNVSLGKAKTYAQTALPAMQRDIVIQQAEIADTPANAKTGLLWYSARKPTTRITHGKRHSLVYTAKEVREFYSRDGNRYNCWCSVVMCLVDSGGNLIASDSFKEKMKAERSSWLKEYA